MAGHRPGVRLARRAASFWSRRQHVERPGWAALDAELNRRTDRPAAFWWRDDDAVAPSGQLSRLLQLREQLGLPLGLAAIPARAEAALGRALPEEGVAILVHGFDHANHELGGRPPAELGAQRRRAEVAAQLEFGLRRLADLFAGRVLPVLAPPFNRIAPRLVASVRQAGFTHVSVDSDFDGLGLASVNVHADVMNWRSRTAAEPRVVIRSLLAALRLRRAGLVSSRRPIGILTHHLVHDDGAWDLAGTLLARLRSHPAATFPPLRTVFQL